MSRAEIVAALVLSGALVAAHQAGPEQAVEVVAVTLVVTGVIAVPLLTLAHELGHAVAAVATGGGTVVVHMGADPPLIRLSVGRIAVRLSPKGCTARCDVDPALRRGRLLLVALAGPGASVLLAVALAILAVALSNEGSVAPFWIAVLAAAASLVLGLANAIPFRRLPSWWPGASSTEPGPSDGLLALRALRQKESAGSLT